MPSLAEIAELSPYLTRLLAARPVLAAEVAASLAHPVTAAELSAWLEAQPVTEANLKPVLRRLKRRAYARIAARDLAGLAPLAEVTECMTLIAELALNKAVEVLTPGLIERYGTPRGTAYGNQLGRAQQLIVVGMGKLGGRELNVSSDIDLIFVFPEDGDTDGARSISNFEFFSRLGRSLIAAIAEATADGQVFRVDMRLRPDGESGPLAGSFDMLENYFFTQGREWERYAWIKARPLTGERHAELEQVRQPFVFRKYLDFGAINAMRDLHAQIRREVAKKDMADNVKLGPGGIREIEFIAQVFQLIRGGGDTPLQVKPTRQVLKLLGERGMLSADTVAELDSAYEFLRRLEHRLQYLEDAQTHSLPLAATDRRRIATAMGFASFEALLEELDDHRATVSQHFEQVFADPNQGRQHALTELWHDAGGEGQAARFEDMGYRDPPAAAQRLVALRSGMLYRQLPQDIRNRYDALVPRLIEAAAATPNPDQTLSRGVTLFESISKRAAYLALLQQYPQALQKVAELVSSSSWAADYLQRHPILLDELLDPRLLDAAPDWPAFRVQLTARLAELEPDTERQMDILREAHHAQVFRLLTQDIAGKLTVEKLADHLSELADILLQAAIERAWLKMPQRHLKSPRFAVISYGKLGGKELAYASDLDLVFLFEDAAPQVGETYARLATRLNTWLSLQTSAGQLFDTDLRLRPNGDSGLPVSSIAAFRKYQFESAWVWEHQALSRARFSAGDRAVGDAFERIRCEVLRQSRDLSTLREEVLAMRQRMLDAHGTKPEARSRSFDLKHDPGGLIDVEFIVQYLVLGYSHQYAQLTGNLGNIALLKIAADLGLIPADLADRVRNAYRDYRRMQHALRLNGARPRVDPELVEQRVDAVRELWHGVFGTAPQ